MSGSLLIWCVLAMATFWSVGVYNRLMRIRARGLSALGSVEKYMKQHGELVRAHAASLRATYGADEGDASANLMPESWDELAVKLSALDAAWSEVRAKPMTAQPVMRVGVAYGELQRAWKYLCDLPADLAGSVLPDDMRLQWEVIGAKVQSARNGFNQILNKYNEAIDQFPARLVAGVMRFEPAGLM